ncbi:hypothetical protein [Paenibacillus sp. FSL K6-2524]|uniref:hypothetical protein n=1 Tax=Paenibacillus sp. FSL K6-2524 TaxID=2954516 RepID=UPI0030FA3637
MPYYRNRLLALILNFIPGLGHLYWGRKGRGIIYPIFFFGGLLGGAFLAMVFNEGGIFAVAATGGLILWVISMLDLLILLLKQPKGRERELSDQYSEDPMLRSDESAERFYTILLSFIPGLGHFQLGLMQRGLSFLISFFGLITMMLFITSVTNQSVFLLFLGLLPIIWLYCMFDAVQLIHRKQAGEFLVDRTLFDEWESGRTEGKRSKVLATLLSAFPGAGQMYLGMQKRGLQLMVLFLGSFYIIDVLRMSVFLFILPVIWFYSFFDGLQSTSRYEREPLADILLIQGKPNHQHWIGIVLVLLGIYYVGMNVVVPLLNNYFPEFRLYHRIDTYLRPAVISLLLIGGGLKLLSKTKKHDVYWDDEDDRLR